MKLLFLLTYYTPHWTGLTQYAKLLAEGMVHKGHDVTVVTTQHEVTLPHEEVIRGVLVKRANPLFSLSRALLSWEILWVFVNEARTCDAVVLFLPLPEVLFATIVGKLFGKRVYLIHNGDLILPHWPASPNRGEQAGLPRRGINRLIELLFKVQTQCSLKLCTTMIVNTMDYAKRSPVVSPYINKCIQIYPPILPVKSTIIRQKQIKHRIGTATHIIGFAGRFVEEKGFDILLKAIPLVVKKIPGVKFIFAGGGVSYENTYERHLPVIHSLQPHLIELGNIPHEEMGSFYDLLSLLVISSRSDFFPFVQIEAMLAKVPVVVTDIPGARVPVQKTGFGKIVPKEDPEKLAEGIVEVLKNRKKYRKNWEKVKKEFDAEESLRKHMEVFTS